MTDGVRSQSIDFAAYRDRYDDDVRTEFEAAWDLTGSSPLHRVNTPSADVRKT